MIISGSFPYKIRVLYFTGKYIRLYGLHFLTLTQFLGHLTENEELSYREIVQSTVQYQFMKFEVQRFTNMRDRSIHLFEVWSSFLVT